MDANMKDRRSGHPTGVAAPTGTDRADQADIFVVWIRSFPRKLVSNKHRFLLLRRKVEFLDEARTN